MIYINAQESKQPSFVVFGDAAKQHIANWDTFSKVAQDNALAIKLLAARTWPSSRVYINARQGFIAVKIDHPKHSIVNELAYNELLLLVDTLKVVDVRTATAQIFRVPK